MYRPHRYGTPAPSPRPESLEADKQTISFLKSGLVRDRSPRDLEVGETPNAIDVLFEDHGIANDNALTLLGTRYAGGGDKTVINIQEFQRKNLTTVLVRMRPLGWDRWNGANWLTLGGALSGLAGDRIYSVVMQDRLVAANKVDRLKSWDGVDGNPVADLSADAPIAYYITPIGNRLVAARVKNGPDFDPYLVRWSADGDITNWTSALLGAGSRVLEPEGKTGAPEFIKGMSSLETALVLYRDRSIMLGVRTGIGSNPFRFNTVVFGLGTDSSYTIANAGQTLGDFFLGNDLNVYLFNGREKPIQVGGPIHHDIRTSMTDPTMAYGIVDKRRGEYWLIFQANGSTYPNVAYILDINAMVTENRLSWRKRNIVANSTVLGFGGTASGINPTVDSVSTIVNLDPHRVDEYGNNFAPQTILVGDNNGGVHYLDANAFLTTGSFETREFGNLERYTRLDRMFLSYDAPILSSLAVDISTDGGLSFGQTKTISLPATGHSRTVSLAWESVVQTYQFRFRILSGRCSITEANLERYDGGPVPSA